MIAYCSEIRIPVSPLFILKTKTHINENNNLNTMYEKRGSPKQHKGFFAKHRGLVAASTLFGTIVGAGILGIPYVVAKAGLLYGLILILLFGFTIMMLNFFTGEVVLRTKTQHQLPGYAEKYLGKNGKRFMMLSMLISIYGALTAYLIGEGNTFYTLFKIWSPLTFSIIFFVITFLIIYRGVKATGRAELILISLLILVVIAIGVFSANKIDSSNFSSFNPAFFFLPYGVILFAYAGMPAVPEMQEQLQGQKKKLKKAIMWGSILPIILYLAFAFIIVGVIGIENFDALQPNERIATIALSYYSVPLLGLFANLLAILAMFTSYLTLGIALLEVYEYDYKIPKWIAFIVTFSLPLAIVLFDLTSFITVLGITGAFAVGLEGIIVVLMYWKAKTLGKRKPEYQMGNHKILGSFLILLFAVGIIYQIIQLI